MTSSPHKAIDWQRVRQRLEAVTAATEAALGLSAEHSRAVMDSRAAALAQVPAAPPSAADRVEVLTFALAGERYAIPTRLVREVQRQPEVTFVPGTPGFVRGVANLRGEVLAVVDLGELLALRDERREDCQWLIVLGVLRAEFGIVADEVQEVLTLRTDAIHPPPSSLTGIGRDYAQGVTSDALIVLGGETLLDDPRLFIDERDVKHA